MDIKFYGEKIYFNQQISAGISIPYHNDDEMAKVKATQYLLDQNCWDSAHWELLEQHEGQWLYLRGTGFGWWKVLDATA
jgi:hypothetical protein